MTHDASLPLSSDEQDVARILQLTGPRPAMDAERAARMRAAVHGVWHDAVQRRRRRRLFAGAAAAGLAVSIGSVLMWRAPAPSGTAAIVLAVTGSTAAASRETAMLDGRALALGDRVPTAGLIESNRSRIALVLVRRGAEVRLDQDTAVRLTEHGVLTVERGRAYIDTGAPGSARAVVEVKTRHGIVRDIGTRFEVRVTDDALRVRVRDGSVIAQNTAGTRPAAAGTELVVRSRGFDSQAISPADEDWSWTTRAAPPFVLEGRTLSAFLEWAAAEGGWRVELASRVRETEVSKTVLHGSIEGLTPREALDVVLPTCGLSHRFDGERLIIDAAAGEAARIR